MARKITECTALTAPSDGDLIPIVDVSDTTDAATGTTKKIAVSSIFPSSSTDNAIARFDGITGKKLGNSNITITESTDSNAALGFSSSGNTTTGSINHTSDTLALGSSGIGTILTLGLTRGSDTSLIGLQGTTTGTGSTVFLQGGAGGATSGDGANAIIYGGNATNGDSSGGSIVLAPGNKTGSGSDGQIVLRTNRTATIGAILDLASISSTSKGFTFPNGSGTLSVATSGAGVPTGTAPYAIGQIYIDTSASKVYISKGTSAGSDWLILN